MSATDTAKPDTAPARRWRPALVAVLLAGAAVAVTGYAARKAIAREALMNWLRSQGVESEITFRAFDADGAAGSLRIGPARDPDLVADVAEIEYDVLGFWDGRPLGLRVTRVRLLEPSLKGRWHDGKLSLGALDPLIESLRKRPPQPDRGQPKIEIDAAHLRLATDYGPVVATADLRANDGKLQRLDARIDPATLKTPKAELALGASELHLVAFGNRLALAAAGRIERLKAPDVAVEGSNLTLAAQAPYPDLKARSADGPLSLTLTADTRTLSQGGRRLDGARQTLALRGALSGPIERLVVRGAVDSRLDAAAADLPGASISKVEVRARAPDFAWTHAATDQVSGTLRLTAAADRLAAGPELVLTRIAGVFEGPAAASPQAWRLGLTGGASAHGAWSGLGPARAGDAPGEAALKRAAAGFLLDARRLTLRAAGDSLAVALDAPISLTPDAGGQVQILAAGGPLYADGAGAFRLVSEGGGLPRAELSVARYRLGPDGVRGDARLAAKGSLGPVVEGSVDVAGGFRLAHAALEVTANRCAPVTAERLELGANDVQAVSGELCPQGGALFRLGDGGWRVKGEARRFAAQVPFLEARLDQAAGPIDLAAKGGDLTLTADLRSVRLTDTAKTTRFRPILAHGTARLAGQVWRGGFDLTDPAGRALAHATLDHDGRSGVGALNFDTGNVVFAEGGLQPSALSPMAAAVGSPAQGQARFQGAVTWTASDSASQGVLDVDRLDFRSAAGAVQGLSGRVVFASLVPLRAAPGQTLRAEAITGLAPMKTAEVTFGLDHEAIQISGAHLGVGGGKVDLKPFEIPFAPGKSWTADLELEGVQLSELVEASPFADRMDLEARVSGHIPVTVGPGGVRIADGEFHAISPGRISIRREALTQVSSAGGTPVAEGPAAPQVPADPYSDFAYQAMEHLAFSQLTAELASQPGGRLGVLFHIRGEHSPPTPQSIRLTWGEVIRRRIDRTLPLPSGTKVDLTLDTSLNLDQLLDEFTEFQGLKNSGSVQP